MLRVELYLRTGSDQRATQTASQATGEDRGEEDVAVRLALGLLRVQAHRGDVPRGFQKGHEQQEEESRGADGRCHGCNRTALRRNGSDVPLHEVQVSLERSDVQHVHHVRHGYEFNRYRDIRGCVQSHFEDRRRDRGYHEFHEQNFGRLCLRVRDHRLGDLPSGDR